MERQEIDLETGSVVSIAVVPFKDASNNLLILDDGDTVPEGFSAISDTEAATLVPKFIPKSVTMRQARLALLQAGHCKNCNK